MIAEIGLGLLWLAAGLAVLQSVLGGLALKLTHRPDLGGAIKPVAIAQGVLATCAFVVLVYLFMISDMSVKLVADNSHSEKPWLYKFSGSWGNHEGSMLLWVTSQWTSWSTACGRRWTRLSAWVPEFHAP